MEWIQLITSLACAIAACLAWAAKIFWSKEYRIAKDETIKSKDEQIRLLEREIDFYKDLTPMKIREYFVSVKAQLEEYNEFLGSQLIDAKKAIEEKKSKIIELEKFGSSANEEKLQLEKQVAELEMKMKELTEATKQYQEKAKQEKSIELKIPDIDISAFDRINVASKNLSSSMGLNIAASQRITEISQIIKSMTDEWAKTLLSSNKSFLEALVSLAWTESIKSKKDKE